MNITEVDFNAEFIARMIPRLEWKALYEAAKMVKYTLERCLGHLIFYQQITCIPSTASPLLGRPFFIKKVDTQIG